MSGTVDGVPYVTSSDPVAQFPVTSEALANAVAARVKKAGDTMTGDLIAPNVEAKGVTGRLITHKPGVGVASFQMESGVEIAARIGGSSDVAIGGLAQLKVETPSQDSHAATKGYADTKVSKSGDTITGDLTVTNNLTVGRTVIGEFTLRQASAIPGVPDGAALWVYPGNRMQVLREDNGQPAPIRIGDPTLASDGATKGYVDNKLPGRLQRGSIVSNGTVQRVTFPVPYAGGPVVVTQTNEAAREAYAAVVGVTPSYFDVITVNPTSWTPISNVYVHWIAVD